MEFPPFVTIVEVGPRDGLQNEAGFVPTETKIEWINLLSETGLSAIETSSFVSQQKIPQLADAHAVFTGIQRHPNIRYSALVPNLQGLELAAESGVKEIAIFAAASETFSQRNIHCSIDESLERYQTVTQKALAMGMRVRSYISCVLGCPYEGFVDPVVTQKLVDTFLSWGSYQVSLGDTIGKGSPGTTRRLLDVVLKSIPKDKIAMHFHNTYGQAIANIYLSLEYGIHTFDASLSGLGGCPYALGATGNVATEDVVYLLNGLGIAHGIDWDKLMAAGRFIDQALDRISASQVARAERG